MKIGIFADAEAAARRAAAFIAGLARETVAQRGQFSLAVSGGTTPGPMFRYLAGENLPWQHVHLFQVDERVAPDGHLDRNLTHLRTSLLGSVPIPTANLHPMPVEAQDLEAAAARYAAELQDVAGSPAVLDLAHLGLGADGHTASLVPGDRVLKVMEADVAVSDSYQGYRRMTLTYPLLNRARRILWVVTGQDKVPALEGLLLRDHSLPAGRVCGERALILADATAAGFRAGP